MYSDADIERLYLLRKATEAGESIGQIANLSTMELRRLVNTSVIETPLTEKHGDVEGHLVSPENYLHACIESISELDARELESTLLKASANLSKPVLLEEVLEPLMYKIGDMWRDGALTTVHEHLGSAVVRSFLGNMAGYEQAAESAPVMIATSPTGQLHEFGALIAAIAASAIGWRSIYLGPNTPAEDIARAVRQSRARAVALSIVYPADDPRVGQEMVKLHRMIDDDVTLFVGGRAAIGYRDIIKSVDAIHMTDLGDFQNKLESIRVGRGAN
jgi:methanogenic corrinoid protein MtbC1